MFTSVRFVQHPRTSLLLSARPARIKWAKAQQVRSQARRQPRSRRVQYRFPRFRHHCRRLLRPPVQHLHIFSRPSSLIPALPLACIGVLPASAQTGDSPGSPPRAAGELHLASLDSTPHAAWMSSSRLPRQFAGFRRGVHLTPFRPQVRPAASETGRYGGAAVY